MDDSPKTIKECFTEEGHTVIESETIADIIRTAQVVAILGAQPYTDQTMRKFTRAMQLLAMLSIKLDMFITAIQEIGELEEYLAGKEEQPVFCVPPTKESAILN